MIRHLLAAIALAFALVSSACGPGNRDNSCSGGSDCMGSCNPGANRECYTGQPQTKGVGPCHAGMQSCTSAGMWGDCMGEVIPLPEICGDNIDNNCNGMVDEDIDADGDGYTTCAGHDCCDSTECSNPAEVNPGAYDYPGDGVDNDCDGMVDNAPLLCDQALSSGSSNAADYAKAMEICQTTTMADPLRHWGLIDAKLTLADGTGTPSSDSFAIRPRFGSGTMPQGGVSVAVISTGGAAAKGDTNPPYKPFVSDSTGTSSPIPADFLAANGGMLPNAPGCPPPIDSMANDPVMLTFTIRVPTNAHAFTLKVNFFSAEFPEFTCTEFNDFFVVLLDSAYAGSPANPTDKNLAFYQQPSTMKNYPVGVNLAFGNTGLFTQCINGSTGCAGGVAGTISTCSSTLNLTATGFDDPASGECDTNSLLGGATGWLTTTGNVKPGEIMKLRIAIWDTSDELYDSLAVVDDFQWLADPSTPGTVIQRVGAPAPLADPRVQVSSTFE